MSVYRIFLLVMIICSFTTKAVSDLVEMPMYSSPPTKFIRSTTTTGASGSAEVKDELVIGDRTAKDMKFWFLLYGGNFHMCSASGVAQALSKDIYQYEENSTCHRLITNSGRYEFKEEQCQCRLKFSFDENHVTLEDVDGNCKEAFCGQRASIGKTIFDMESSN